VHHFTPFNSFKSKRFVKQLVRKIKKTLQEIDLTEEDFQSAQMETEEPSSNSFDENHQQSDC
jgi:hypothetical protein